VEDAHDVVDAEDVGEGVHAAVLERESEGAQPFAPVEQLGLGRTLRLEHLGDPARDYTDSVSVG